MFRTFYDVVMDPEKNPLRHLTPYVRFQLMVILAWMWSAIFSLFVGSLAIFGPTVAAHLLLLVGLFVTHRVFRSARGWSVERTSKHG